MRRTYKIISDLVVGKFKETKPVYANAELDINQASAIWQDAKRVPYSTPGLMGLGYLFYDCIFVQIGPNVFHLELNDINRYETVSAS